MKKETFFEVLGDLDDALVKGAEDPKRAKPIPRRAWGAAACLVAALALGVWSFGGQEWIALSDASSGVSARYIPNAPEVGVAAQLLPLTEEELFSRFDTMIFKGTVTGLDNIELRFNGQAEYRAVAKIEVQTVYRGSCREGEVLTVLLPCPVGNGVWMEDTETVAAMEVGMAGIFMPLPYDGGSYREQNGARLALRDLADCGFLDGSRYAFLETEKGLVFDRWAYGSIADAATLEEVEDYITRMLDPT